MKTILLALAAFIILSLGASAQTLYNTDFSGSTAQYTGTGVLSGDTEANGNTYWGGYDTPPQELKGPSSTPYSLNTSSGASSKVTLSLSGSFAFFIEGSTGPYSSGELYFTNPVNGDAIYNNYYTVQAGLATMTLAGLNPLTTYNIVLYGDNQDGDGGRTTAISTNGGFTSETLTSGGGESTFTSVGNALTGFTGNYIEVTGLSNATGGLIIDLSVPTGDMTGEAFGGLSIQAASTPEPSSLSLFLIGAALLGSFALFRLRHS